MEEPDFPSLSVMQNPGMREYMERRQGINGKSQRLLALETLSLRQSLKATGIAKPASVLNFNPVALRLEGGLSEKVPSVVDPSVAPKMKHRLVYKAKEYSYTLLDIPEPKIYAWIKDVKQPEDGDPADGVGEYEPRACKQVEIAHAFFQAYNQGATDSSNMGGVLVFEGDKNLLRTTLKAFSEGKDPQINVPTFTSLPNRKREYYAEPKAFAPYLAEVLDKQRIYYDGQMQQAGIFNDDPEQKKNITQVHRVWHQFGMDMGWTDKQQPWLLTQNDPEETCEGCGATKKRALAYFCHACARPYDPFRCFMDNELGIESVFLNRCTPDQWKEIRKKANDLKRLREGL